MRCSASYESFFFFNDTATTEIYTLSLHDALPISSRSPCGHPRRGRPPGPPSSLLRWRVDGPRRGRRSRLPPRRRLPGTRRSEEHTSELQSRQYLVCRLLLEKKHRSFRRRATPCIL